MLQTHLLRHWLVVRLTGNVIGSTPVHNAVFRIYDSIGISLNCFLYRFALPSPLSNQYTTKLRTDFA